MSIQYIPEISERERLRMHLWTEIATAVARAEGSKSRTIPGEWADVALAAFDARFPKQEKH